MAVAGERAHVRVWAQSRSRVTFVLRPKDGRLCAARGRATRAPNRASWLSSARPSQLLGSAEHRLARSVVPLNAVHQLARFQLSRHPVLGADDGPANGRKRSEIMRVSRVRSTT